MLDFFVSSSLSKIATIKDAAIIVSVISLPGFLFLFIKSFLKLSFSLLFDVVTCPGNRGGAGKA